jgi:hypothetical protein
LDYFDETVDRVAKCKARYLEVQYLLYLETRSSMSPPNSIKIEKLNLELKSAYRELIRTADLIGRGSSIYLGLAEDVREYIKSKGHKPRKTFGAIFIMGIFSTFVTSLSTLWSVKDFVSTGKSVDIYALVLGATITVSVWIWWSSKETF